MGIILDIFQCQLVVDVEPRKMCVAQEELQTSLDEATKDMAELSLCQEWL